MFTQRDLKFFNVAKSVAITSYHAKVRIGSVIVEGGEIISVGVNGYKTHPIQMRYDSCRGRDFYHHYLHAEMAALVKAIKIKRGDRIYTYRVGRDGDPRMCRPCSACMRALLDHDIVNIYYSSNNGMCFEYLGGGK